MKDSDFLAFVDALGNGVCGLRTDGTVDAISPGFTALTGLGDDTVGKPVSGLIEGLPALDGIAQHVADGGQIRQIGPDGVARELIPVRAGRDDGAGTWLVLIDRSGEEKLRRRQAQLGRKLADLRAELEARQRTPRRPGVRSMHELATRLDEAVQRARRYDHAVTVLRVQLDASKAAEGDVDEGILGCIRAVDDAGLVGDHDYAVVLPHTDLKGGKIVADRIGARLRDAGCDSVSVGAAQLQREEESSGLVARAEQACLQAVSQGGGILVAVDVT